VAITIHRDATAFSAAALSVVSLLGQDAVFASFDAATNTVVYSVRVTDEVRAALLTEADSWAKQGNLLVSTVNFEVTGTADNYTIDALSDDVRLLLTKKLAEALGISV
jgi:uncharacterized membrane protein